MGVRGLQTFLEQHCREACYSVDIEKLAREFKCRTGEDAKIVVDAQSCYSLWYKGLDWMVGFEVQEIVNRLRTFVDCFKKLGIKLIFFFGGLTPKKKRSEWIRRRRANIDETHIIFDVLKSGGDMHASQNFNSIPPNMGVTASYVLKYILGCQVYMSVDECDEEIVDYVHKHNCFAVFGQDTDFVVSELNDALFLSSKNFNNRTMTTLRYDREKLAQHLQIGCHQLPFLALLAGSDLIRFDLIKAFHRRLCNIDTSRGMVPFNVLMPAIGRYINSLPKKVPFEKTLERIATDLFEDASQAELLKMIHTSYFVRETKNEGLPEDAWLRILYIAKYRHRNCVVPNIVFSIMNDRIFECSISFEDLRITHDGNPLARDRPSSTVTRPLRLRLYGVLFHEKRPPFTVEEFCADNCDSYLKPVLVEPIKPSVQHPGLLTLWSDCNNDSLIEKRWELFLTSIHPSLKQKKLQLFADNLISGLSAYYLYKEQFLNQYELDAVLASIATYRLYRQHRANSIQYELDFRAAQISVTFIKTYGFILTLLGACGYPVELSPENAIPKFEGKLFQKKYAEVKKDPINYRRNALCENDRDCLDIFYRLRNFIMPETMHERNKNRKKYHVQKFA